MDLGLFVSSKAWQPGAHNSWHVQLCSLQLARHCQLSCKGTSSLPFAWHHASQSLVCPCVFTRAFQVKAAREEVITKYHRDTLGLRRGTEVRICSAQLPLRMVWLKQMYSTSQQPPIAARHRLDKAVHRDFFV